MVDREERLVEEGVGRGSEGPGAGVAGVETLAARQHCAQRSDVRSGGVARSMSQPETARSGGEGRLQPGLARQGPSAQALQASADFRVKVAGRTSKQLRRGDS